MLTTTLNLGYEMIMTPNNIEFVHKVSTLLFVFGPPLILLNIVILTSKIEKLSAYLDLVAHEKVIRDREVRNC
jgi:hypothetical protein